MSLWRWLSADVPVSRGLWLILWLDGITWVLARLAEVATHLRWVP